MNWGIISGVIAGAVSLISIASFFIARMKDAEERGAMKQQIKDLAAQVVELKGAIGLHADKIGGQETCMAGLEQKIESIEKNVESINQKLDRILDRQAAGRPV